MQFYGEDLRTNKTITVDGQEFSRVALDCVGTNIVSETYFASDKSYIKVIVDYRFTEKGYK